METDIRWEQRFSNFIKAVDKLEQSVLYIRKNFSSEESKYDEVLDEMIKEGLIQRFEYTHELAWNVMKDYAGYQGNPNVGGSRDASREAFQLKLITDGQLWMDMISSRLKTFDTYKEDIADEIYDKILNQYYPSFMEFKQVMEQKISGKQHNLFEE